MSLNSGVWIDHRQATVVLLKGSDHEIKRVISGIERPAWSKANHSSVPHDPVADDRLERKLDSTLRTFYDEVIEAMQGSDATLIVGPGEAKGELHKRLKVKKPKGLAIAIEPADRMTDRQLLAKVTQHFAMNSSSESDPQISMAEVPDIKAAPSESRSSIPHLHPRTVVHPVTQRITHSKGRAL